MLLNAGADINVANPAGYTALISFTDHYMDNKPLQAEVLSLLLAANAKIDTLAKNSVCHLTPLLHACMLHLQKVVEVLIGLGASLEDHFKNVRPSSNGITALALMVEWTPAERISTGPMKTDRWLHGILERHVMPLLSRDEDGELRYKLLETADFQGGGILHFAAGAGLIQTCTMLLTAKVAVNKLRRVEKDVTRLGIRGKEISFTTPLDEVMKAKESCRFKTQYVQEEGMTPYLMRPYDFQSSFQAR